AFAEADFDLAHSAVARNIGDAADAVVFVADHHPFHIVDLCFGGLRARSGWLARRLERNLFPILVGGARLAPPAAVCLRRPRRLIAQLNVLDAPLGQLVEEHASHGVERLAAKLTQARAA